MCQRKNRICYETIRHIFLARSKCKPFCGQWRATVKGPLKTPVANYDIFGKTISSRKRKQRSFRVAIFVVL